MKQVRYEIGLVSFYLFNFESFFTAAFIRSTLIASLSFISG